MTLAAEDGNPDIKNKIGIALVNRIVRAHTEGKKFRVIVVMPLMPAFEADIMSSEAGTLRKVMHFQYVSICRGGNSILDQLLSLGIDPDQYIGFFGLRSFDRIKHGKFDAIAEAVKEQMQREEEDKPEAPMAAEAMAAVPEPPVVHPQVAHIAEGGDIRRSKSLATKYLLDPVPRNRRAAERIKRIRDERRAADLDRTWDDSITKKAMNPAKREHGFVPKTTEREMDNSPDNKVLREETREAERRARETHYQGSAPGNKDKHYAEGFGTLVRSAINNATQPKEQGGLVPKHHSLSDVLHHQSEGSSSLDRPGEEVRKLSIQNVRDHDNIEAIVEPAPKDTDVGEGEGLAPKAGSTSKAGSTHDSEGSDDTIVDNEVEDFVTEQLYIHSKLMIVDDKIIIIGSGKIPRVFCVTNEGIH